MRALALHSLKGGVGKTTTAVNLAFLAAKEGLRTLIWDVDPQGAASLYLGVGTGVSGGAERVLRGKDLEISVKRSAFENLWILPADLSFRLVEVELDSLRKPKKRIARVLEGLAGSYDLMVLDAPPGLGLLSEAILRACDLLLVPIIPSPLGVYVYERMNGHLAREGYSPERQRAFFSMVDRRRKSHSGIVETYAGKAPGFLSSTIPAAAEIERMGLHRSPLGAYSKDLAVTGAFAALWEEARAHLGMRSPAPSTIQPAHSFTTPASDSAPRFA